jgi:ABC-type branched-subunit amino acid transport system substrate-binding protein
MDYINDNGGFTVNGQKYTLKLSMQDNQFNPDRAAAAAQSLVSDGVKYVAGAYPEFIRMAINSVLRPANVFYSPCYDAGDPPEMDPDLNKYTFYTNGGTMAFFLGNLETLQKIHPEVKSLSFLLIDDGSIKTSEPLFHKIATSLGYTLNPIVGYAPTTTDYSPYAQKLIAQNPDAILVGNGPTEGESTTLRLFREQGYTKPVCMVNANPIDDVITVAGKAASTNFITLSIRGDTPGLPPLVQEISKRATAQHGKLDNLECTGFTAVYAPIKIIEMAQSFDVPTVAAKWETLSEIPSGYSSSIMSGKEFWGFNHFANQKMYSYSATDGVPVANTNIGWVQLHLPTFSYK